MSGAFAMGEAGSFAMAASGAREMSRRKPFDFGVCYIDQVDHSYYDHNQPPTSPQNLWLRDQFDRDLEAFLAARHEIDVLRTGFGLIHVQAKGDPPMWWRLTPPNREIPEEVIHIQMVRNPEFFILWDTYRQILRTLNSPEGIPGVVVPAYHWVDSSRSMWREDLEPGWSGLGDYEEYINEIVYQPLTGPHAELGERWLAWLTRIIDKIVVADRSR